VQLESPLLSFVIISFTPISAQLGSPPPAQHTRLSPADKAEWRSRILASVNAAILIVGRTLWFAEWPYEPISEGCICTDRIWSHPVVCGLCIALCWVSLQRGFVLAHLAPTGVQGSLGCHSPCPILMSVTRYVLWGAYFKKAYARLSFTELSTPFLNVR
jgi:hypothetical protein